jgi:hypothetical protein
MQLFKEVYHEDVFVQISQPTLNSKCYKCYLAVISDFNYDLIMLKEILINKIHYCVSIFF